MTRTPARGGQGSNQYQTRGVSSTLNADAREAIAQAVSAESTAWAFVAHADDVVSELERTRANAVRFAAHPNPQIRVRAAGNRGSSPELLDVLADDSDGGVVLAVTANRSTAPDTLERIARTVHEPAGRLDIREMLAGNPNTPRPVYDLLFADPDRMLRRGQSTSEDYTLASAAAGNPGCPGDVLEFLYQAGGVSAKKPRILNDLAANPSCPPGVLDRLAQEEGRLGTAAIANPACPPARLQAVVLSDPDLDHVHEALQNPSCPEPMLRHALENLDLGQHEAVAANPELGDLMRDEVAYLCPSSPAAVNAAVCSEDSRLLRFLYEEGSDEVRDEVVKNPSAPAYLAAEQRSSRQWRRE